MLGRTDSPVTPSPSSPVFTTRKGAAKLIGVSTVTIDAWIADGRLPAYRVGDNLVRIKVEDVEALFVPIQPKVAAR